MEIPEDRNPGGLTRSRAHAHSGGQQSPGPLLPLRQASAPKPSGKAWPRALPLVRAPPLRRAPPHPGPAHLSMMPFMRMALFQSLRVDLPARCTNSFGLMTCSSYCGEEQSGVRTGLPAAPLRQPSAQSRPRCPSACRSASPVAMLPLGRGLGRLSPQPGAAAPRQAPSRPPGNTVHSYIHHGIDWRPARVPRDTLFTAREPGPPRSQGLFSGRGSAGFTHQRSSGGGRRGGTSPTSLGGRLRELRTPNQTAFTWETSSLGVESQPPQRQEQRLQLSGARQSVSGRAGIVPPLGQKHQSSQTGHTNCQAPQLVRVVQTADS